MEGIVVSWEFHCYRPLIHLMQTTDVTSTKLTEDLLAAKALL